VRGERKRAAEVEFVDLVRAVVGLDPIPNAPCSRNRPQADEVTRFGDVFALTGLFALDDEPAASSGTCPDDPSS